MNTSSPYEVKSYIKTKSGVASAKVYWTTDITQPYNSVDMTMSQDTFRANIPAQSLGTNVYYYISATSNSGRTSTKPLTAPEGYIKFTIDNPTSISQNTFAPEEYSLSQNYPNPFNPTTNLEFGISKLGFVSLKVYNSIGMEVATLVNENKPAGSYSVTFDGSGLSSGIYFYRLTAGNFNEVKKMTLLK